MKKLFCGIVTAIVLFAAVLGIFPCVANAENSDYYIRNFNVDITVNKDRTYTVAETLDVYFNNECHGIIRNIPTYAKEEREVRIEKVDVEGAPFDYDGYGTIKIGDPEETVKGNMRYIIKYTLWQYADEATDFDFAYINVLGTEWDAYTENFTAYVHLPKDFVLDRYSLTDGRYGNDENRLSTIEVGEDNEIKITSNGRMEPYEGITLKMFFPEGSFSEAEAYVPDLVFNSVEVNGKMDNEGRADITINYNVTVNKASGFWLDLKDSDEFNRSKIESCKVTTRYRTTEEDYDYVHVDLYSYEGETVDVSLHFVKQYYVRGGTGNYEYAQLLFDRMYDSYGDKLSVHFEFPFEVEKAELRKRINSYYGESNVYSEVDVTINGKAVDIDCTLDSENDYFLYVSMPAASFVHYKSFTDAFIPALGSFILLVMVYFVFVVPRYTHRPIPAMYPPEGLTPAEVGYILSGKFDKKYIPAMVLYWASKGFIKIRREGKNFVLTRLERLSGAKPFESELYSFLWQDSNVFSTADRHFDFDDKIGSAARKLEKSLGGKSGVLNMKSRVISVAFGLVMPIFCMLTANIMVIVKFDSSSSGLEFLNILFNVSVPALLYLRGRALERTMYEKGHLVGRIFSGIYVLALTFLTASCFETTSESLICAKGVGFAFMTVCCLAAFAGPFMKRRTPKAKELLTQAVGYKRFLEHMPLDKMQVLLSMDKNAYYNVLPYAMAMGLAKTVTKSFNRFGNNVSSPEWYDADIRYDNNMYDYLDYRTFNNFGNRMKASVSTHNPSSDSSGGGSDYSGGGFSGGDFSGGGSSGGGSGGGGGTSW